MDHEDTAVQDAHTTCQGLCPGSALHVMLALQQFPLITFYPLPLMTTECSVRDLTFHGGLMGMESREKQTPWYGAMQDFSSAGHTESLTLGERRIGQQPRQGEQGELRGINGQKGPRFFHAVKQSFKQCPHGIEVVVIEQCPHTFPQ